MAIENSKYNSFCAEDWRSTDLSELHQHAKNSVCFLGNS